jgi:hypothetical protein
LKKKFFSATVHHGFGSAAMGQDDVVHGVVVGKGIIPMFDVS